MKFYLSTLVLMFVLTFSACSKREPDTDNNIYTVKFRATGFSQAIKDFDNTNIKMSNVGNDLPKSSKLISHLYFVVFDLQGKAVQTVSQDSSKTIDFGSAEISLPAGSYKIAVVGTSNYAKLPFNDHRMYMEDLENFKIDFFYSVDKAEIKETFCSELVPFEVNGSDVNTEIVVKRVTSQLDVVIEDKIPEQAGYFVLEIPSRSDYYFFSKNPENVILLDQKDLYNLGGKTNVKFSTVLFAGLDGVNSSKTLKIKFYDKSRTLFSTRTVENIRFEKNKITQIKGNILGSNTDPVSADVETEFDGKISYTF